MDTDDQCISTACATVSSMSINDRISCSSMEENTEDDSLKVGAAKSFSHCEAFSPFPQTQNTLSNSIDEDVGWTMVHKGRRKK